MNNGSKQKIVPWKINMKTFIVLSIFCHKNNSNISHLLPETGWPVVVVSCFCFAFIISSSLWKTCDTFFSRYSFELLKALKLWDCQTIWNSCIAHSIYTHTLRALSNEIFSTHAHSVFPFDFRRLMGSLVLFPTEIARILRFHLLKFLGFSCASERSIYYYCCFVQMPSELMSEWKNFRAQY